MLTAGMAPLSTGTRGCEPPTSPLWTPTILLALVPTPSLSADLHLDDLIIPFLHVTYRNKVTISQGAEMHPQKEPEKERVFCLFLVFFF